MIRDSVPRIGKVTLKGGAQLHVVQTAKGLSELHSTLLDDAGRVHRAMPDAVGYFMVAWDRQGGFQRAYYSVTSESPVPLRLLPAFVEEVARGYLVDRSIVGELRERGLVRS